MSDKNGSPQACCFNPHLVWTPVGLCEPIITCTSCGFMLDPDGVLLDWCDPEEVEAAQVIEENLPRILELAAKLGLTDAEKEQEAL